MSSEDQLLQAAQKLIPSLSSSKHKGQDGRIGIVGGSLEYSGAPFFAGMSALRTGADLVHIFCSKEASTPIKSFSPELIVHPVLDSDNALNQIEPWLDRLHVLLIGPGLGRDEKVLMTVSKLITTCRGLSKPLVIDADGLFLVGENPDLIKNYPGVILTPNAMEFTRLVKSFLNKTIQPGEGPEHDNNIVELAKAIGGNTTIVAKGSTDVIGNASGEKLKCAVSGSGRRCGGQGDILAGSLSTFLAWGLRSTENNASLLASYAACRLVRETNEVAFREKGRGMLASDMIKAVTHVFRNIFEIIEVTVQRYN